MQTPVQLLNHAAFAVLPLAADRAHAQFLASTAGFQPTPADS
ncbi:hypothetical protein AB4Z46_21975 [Variovorax sp. M-6]